ncbi:MAG: sulfite exporter TauE/SafE family protein [Alphaproteobacteria bacterium]|nr:sulfite exporter TauE/SafE family protein [Alphaproteobacteria bacterium]
MAYDILIIGGLSIIASIVCFFCAMAGSGSGLILVPLMILSGLTPVQAIAIHKFEALWTVASGWRYYKNDCFLKTDFNYYLFLGLIGTYIGARFIHFIPNDVLQISVALLILAVSIFINFSGKFKSGDTLTKTKRIILITSMFFFGIYEGTFGSGNGFFIAALFFYLIGSDEQKTVCMITILAAFWNIAATLTHFTFGSLLWHYALPIGIMAAIGAWFGAGYAMKVDKAKIRHVIFTISCIGGSILLLQSLI